MKRIKIVIPPTAGEETQQVFVKGPTLGVGLISSYLKNQGYDVEQTNLLLEVYLKNKKRFLHKLNLFKYINLSSLNNKEIEDYIKFGIKSGNIKRTLDKIINLTEWDNYLLLCFSILSVNQFICSLLLMRRIKEDFRVPVVIGGPYINATPIKELSYPFIDYIAKGGDANQILFNILDSLNKGQPLRLTSGLYYLDGGSHIGNKDEDYDKITMRVTPTYDSTELYGEPNERKKYGLGPYLPYEINKGCPYRCIFCQFRVIDGNVEMESDLIRVIKDLKKLTEKHKVKDIWFTDPTLNRNYKMMMEFCDLLIEHKLNINWFGWIIPKDIDDKLAEKMSRAGCKYVILGVESGSPRMIRYLQKSHTLESSEEALRNLSNNGINCKVNIIVGAPHEKDKDIRLTLDFIKRNKDYINLMSVSIFKILDGTLIHKYPEKYGVCNLKKENIFDINRNWYRRRVIYSFDEINGLKWEEKRKQQIKAGNIILKARLKYIIRKNTGGIIKYMPLSLYNFFKNRVEDIF